MVIAGGGLALAGVHKRPVLGYQNVWLAPRKKGIN